MNLAPCRFEVSPRFQFLLPTIRKVLEGVEARTIERINNAQINNVFVAADRFAEFVGQMNKAIEAMPAHDRLKSYVSGS